MGVSFGIGGVDGFDLDGEVKFALVRVFRVKMDGAVKVGKISEHRGKNMLDPELNGGMVGINGPVISPGRGPGGDGKNEYQKTGDGKAFHDDLLDCILFA
jgi:hypothetical protein